ncbi:hypothetical protein NECAME_07937 [Necator americanus]|uniref:Uncharacterized protein n=1 Tax=Necator americanus TaxID=51031 RepID=W2TNB3_NECAM|nr:hypothetical protein NECAME_07937 [Necator americanus]ETN82492.1 hypothetical protein NECAME_07937 [Necator americanus]
MFTTLGYCWTNYGKKPATKQGIISDVDGGALHEKDDIKLFVADLVDGVEIELLAVRDVTKTIKTINDFRIVWKRNPY